MTNLKKSLCKAVVTASLIGLLSAGCMEKANNQLSYRAIEIEDVIKDPKKYENQPISIQGRPYGLGVNDGNNELVIFIEEKNKGILCSAKTYGNDRGKRLAKIEALVEAEINDNTTEPITVKGIYNKGEFEIVSIEIKGYAINLR